MVKNVLNCGQRINCHCCHFIMSCQRTLWVSVLCLTTIIKEIVLVSTLPRLTRSCLICFITVITRGVGVCVVQFEEQRVYLLYVQVFETIFPLWWFSQCRQPVIRASKWITWSWGLQRPGFSFPLAIIALCWGCEFARRFRRDKSGGNVAESEVTLDSFSPEPRKYLLFVGAPPRLGRTQKDKWKFEI
jgi:hypothetical protein